MIQDGGAHQRHAASYWHLIVSALFCILVLLDTGKSFCHGFSIITIRQVSVGRTTSSEKHLMFFPHHSSSSSSLSSSSSDDDDSSSSSDKKITGDKLREATGIRPSLHPTTINAIADALKTRSLNKKDLPLRVTGNGVKPLDVALSAGRIATTAIGKRQEASKQDGMVLTPDEEQVIAGRVLGVIMRFDELEEMLREKVTAVDWISKFNEYATFGVIKKEIKTNDDDDVDISNEVDSKIKDDPLLSMNRAECLLALFIHNIVIPQMKKVGQDIVDGSKIDFLDEDRVDVLLS